MIPQNKLGRQIQKKLKVYADPTIPTPRSSRCRYEIKQVAQ